MSKKLDIEKTSNEMVKMTKSFSAIYIKEHPKFNTEKAPEDFWSMVHAGFMVALTFCGYKEKDIQTAYLLAVKKIEEFSNKKVAKKSNKKK